MNKDVFVPAPNSPCARLNVTGGTATGATLQAQVAEIFATDPNYKKAGITQEKVQYALGKPNLAEPRKLICPLYKAAWLENENLDEKYIYCDREACAIWQGYRCGLARV